MAVQTFCHLLINLLASNGVYDARLEDIRIVQNGAVALCERQNHGHLIIHGVGHDIGHLVLVRRAYDKVGLDCRLVELVDGLKPVVGVKHIEIDISPSLTKAVKSQTHTLIELNISAALKIV